MNSGGIEITKDGFTDKMNDILGRAQHAKGGFARIYRLYQGFQTQRFQTQNASEGSPWPELNSVYARYKIRRYGGGPRRKSHTRAAGVWASYPGGGTKMMIGTSMLAGAAIGPGAPFEGTGQHRAMFTDSEMFISVEESGNNPDGQSFDYPHHAAISRPFMTFSPASIQAMKKELIKFIFGTS